jgi:copper chaperone NosL
MHQPDVQHLIGSVYVQNVGESGFNWRHPSNSASSFINARKAWYVANQDVCGSMGPTLAPFLHRSDAVEFSKKHGGQIVRFTQITSRLLKHLKSCTINFKFKKMGKMIAKPPELK